MCRALWGTSLATCSLLAADWTHLSFYGEWRGPSTKPELSVSPSLCCPQSHSPLLFPLPSSRHPCPAIPLSRVPSPPIHISSGSSSIPLTSLDISDYILKSEYSELRSTNKRKHVAFVLLALGYLLIQYDIFQCHSFTCQFRDFIFLYH